MSAEPQRNQGERLVALEVQTYEHARRLNALNGQIAGMRDEQAKTNEHFAEFREETVQVLSSLTTKTGIYAAIGGAVGGAAIAGVVALLVFVVTGHHPAVEAIP